MNCGVTRGRPTISELNKSVTRPGHKLAEFVRPGKIDKIGILVLEYNIYISLMDSTDDWIGR